MTDAERLEAIKAHHHECRCEMPGAHCAADKRAWPCDTAVALAEVERLRGVVEEIGEDMYAALDSAKRENGGSGLIWADAVARWRDTLLAEPEGKG